MIEDCHAIWLFLCNAIIMSEVKRLLGIFSVCMLLKISEYFIQRNKILEGTMIAHQLFARTFPLISC